MDSRVFDYPLTYQVPSFFSRPLLLECNASLLKLFTRSIHIICVERNMAKTIFLLVTSMISFERILLCAIVVGES